MLCAVIYRLHQVGWIDYDIARVTSIIGDIHKLLDVTLPNYLVGNFNLRNIDWYSSCTLGLHPENTFTRFVIENAWSHSIS